ncbi:MAG: two-component sensor histidine kinase [Desulfobacterales bacterium]|nr:MAG: two-component sensor histidine kinase [Desulfobacterales bacterium]
MMKKRQLAIPYYRLLMRNIVFVIISVSFIPLILVSSTIYYQFRTSYREKVYAHLRELVQNHTQNIDSFLSEKLGDIRFLAGSFGYDQLSDESFLQEKLAALQKDYGPVFVDLGVVNDTGEQIAYAGPFKLAKAHYSDAEWFQQAMQRQYFISDVFLGLRGLPHFIVAVKTSQNEHSWILRSTIDFVAFNTLVESIRIGETGFAVILNKEGILQTTPMTKPSLDTIPAKSIYAEFLENRARSADEIRIAVKPDGSNHQTIFVASFLKNGDWLLVYQQHLADAFADLNKTFTITTVMMLLGPLCIVIMAITLSKIIVNRIAQVDEEKQLMNEKVVETGKLASVGELAAGVAHEINNPVAIMVEEAGWIGDLLEEEEIQDSKNLAEFRRAIGQIQAQGKRCKEITQKLLSFARKTDGTVQDIEINEMLEELVTLSAQRAKFAMVSIQTHFQKNLPHLQLSLSELQQVFLNLINNSLDAMENSGGSLTIASRLEQDRIVVEVSDSGRGIPEANLNRIFDPFFTTKPVGKGTGLGLSICYGIIDKMGGKIEVRSAVGKGTTFYVSLPVPKEEVTRDKTSR